jgi:hypothetical protein
MGANRQMEVKSENNVKGMQQESSRVAFSSILNYYNTRHEFNKEQKKIVLRKKCPKTPISRMSND